MLRLLALLALIAAPSCAGAPADEAVAPQPAAASAGESAPQDAALVRPFEDDGRTQRERDLETVGRTGGR